MLDHIEGWRSYARLHAAQTDPRRKAMAANMMDHYKWEMLGYPERLLEGVHADAEYRFYGTRGGADAMILTGHDQIRSFYQQMVDTGGNLLQMDNEDLLIDDKVVAGQGVMHQVVAGKDLTGDGFSAAHPDVDDVSADYLVSQRYAFFLPFSADEVPMLMGEICYFYPPLLSIRKVAKDEVLNEKVTEDMFTL